LQKTKILEFEEKIERFILFVFLLIKQAMPKKGKAKNTLNKAKHTKLMNRKINKVKLEKQLHKERLKAIIKKVCKEKVKE
jgi:hypothetical protein